MKICHVITCLDVGGAELALKRLVQSRLAHSSYDDFVISLTTVGKVGLELRESGIKVYALGMRSILDAPLATWRLIKLVYKVRPDVVQTWMYHADLLGGIAARIVGHCGIIWGIRATDAVTVGSKLTILIQKACAALSRFIPHVIVCVAEVSRRVHIALGYDASRMVVVPNGFNLKQFDVMLTARNDLRVQCGFTSEHLVVGCVGRFHAHKNYENFIEAAGLMARHHGEVRFLMVGRGIDIHNTALMEWIAATGYENRFVLLGERNDVPVCLAAMDFFCLPSRSEGFPNVVAEAMASSLPCIVTDVGDAAFLTGDNGIVVPKENAMALADGLLRLVAMSSAERFAMGKKARDRIESDFSMNKMCERFENIYKRLIEEKSRS